MSTQLQICDTTTSGTQQPLFRLTVPTERITVSDLIRCRVYQEVMDYNQHQPEYFRSLVQPVEAQPRQLDWQQQADLAIAAFLNNRFLILVGDRQVSELNEEIDVLPDQVVTFLRLVPLVGG